MSYEGRTAYRCKRCHEWAFISDAERTAAKIMSTDVLDCPFCSEASGLSEVGRVNGAQIVSQAERTPCDSACTSARGILCVCACLSVNHGTGRVMRVTRVEGKLVAVLNDMARAQRLQPKILAQIAEYEAAYAAAESRLLSYSRSYSYHVYYAKRDLRQSKDMHSHAGRMKRVASAIVSMDKADASAAFKAQTTVVAAVRFEATPSPIIAAVQSGAVVALDEFTPVRIIEYATPRQVSYLASLIRDRGTAEDRAVDLRELSKADASRYIERMLSIRVQASA